MVRQVLQEPRLCFKIRGDLKKRGNFQSEIALLTIRLKMKEVLWKGLMPFSYIDRRRKKTRMALTEKQI